MTFMQVVDGFICRVYTITRAYCPSACFTGSSACFTGSSACFAGSSACFTGSSACFTGSFGLTRISIKLSFICIFRYSSKSTFCRKNILTTFLYYLGIRIFTVRRHFNTIKMATDKKIVGREKKNFFDQKNSNFKNIFSKTKIQNKNSK